MSAPTDYAEPLVLTLKALRLFGNEMALGRHHVAAHLLYQAKRHMEQLTEMLSAQIMPARPFLEPDAMDGRFADWRTLSPLFPSKTPDDRPVESPPEAQDGLRNDSTGPAMVYAHLSQQDR